MFRQFKRICSISRDLSCNKTVWATYRRKQAKLWQTCLWSTVATGCPRLTISYTCWLLWGLRGPCAQTGLVSSLPEAPVCMISGSVSWWMLFISSKKAFSSPWPFWVHNYSLGFFLWMHILQNSFVLWCQPADGEWGMLKIIYWNPYSLQCGGKDTSFGASAPPGNSCCIF